jgi:hypothetical protein
MPPLILHNVPDEELYIGEDGIQRPYAMLFPGYILNPRKMKAFADLNRTDGTTTSRSRRAAPETGSFGKASTRRSKSRSQTPAPKVAKEDPTLAAADAIFTSYLAKQAVAPPDPSQRQRKTSIPSSTSQPIHSLSTSLEHADGKTGPTSRYVHKEPTEVILRGFKATLQWAAIREYERIGGRICEDYPRDPPSEQRKFKDDLRDPAVLRKRALTSEEKAKALRYDGGEHWIKITFESAEAAEAAIDSSPQTIMGYTVYAEMYRGVKPTAPDEAIPANREQRPTTPRLSRNTFPRSVTTPSMIHTGRGLFSVSPPDSQTSSQTLDTATLSTTSMATTSTATMTGGPTNTITLSLPFQNHLSQSEFCRNIPTAKRIQLLPAEKALMPQKSWSQRILSKIPLISWLSSDIIGSTVPKNENGEFDWAKASMYWRLIHCIDGLTGWFDIAGPDKED